GDRILGLPRPLHVLRRNLRRDVHGPRALRRAVSDRFAQELLALSLPVRPRRVEEVAAERERAIDRAQRLLIVGAAPAAHAPHPVPDFRHCPARAAERSITHIQSSLMISHEIIGDDMQAVVITMASGDEVRAEAGAMTYMTGGIEMDARMQGGLLGGLK